MRVAFLSDVHGSAGNYLRAVRFATTLISSNTATEPYIAQPCERNPHDRAYTYDRPIHSRRNIHGRFVAPVFTSSTGYCEHRRRMEERMSCEQSERSLTSCLGKRIIAGLFIHPAKGLHARKLCETV